MGPRLTDEVFAQLCTQGYAIVPRYFSEEQRAAMAAALRRLLKPWDQVRHDPPANRRDSYFFPYPEQVLNSAIVDREAIALARRWLGTDRIQYRPGLGLVTYPGFRGDSDRAHIDNGNNSLLPPTLEDRGHSQIIFWFYLEDVDEDQAPTRFLATADGQDTSRAVPMVAPGGSVALFHNYTWHAATAYTRPYGQRYVWKFAFGRADHYWEGTAHYTQVGRIPTFANSSAASAPATASCSAFRPPATPTTRRRRCRRWRKQYPGWNRDGAYGPT